MSKPKTSTSKPPRLAVDWEAVERKYRIGRLSVREIADAHGVSHTAVAKRAKRLEWQRNLQPKIIQAVKAKMVAANPVEVSKAQAATTEAETVETEAERVATVLRAQRAAIRPCRQTRLGAVWRAGSGDRAARRHRRRDRRRDGGRPEQAAR